jgi:hypothetical protein
MKTAIEKLAERDEDKGLIKRHVSWGPEGHKMTQEEKAEYILQIEDQVAAELANTVSIPVSVLTDISDALHNLHKLGQATIDEWTHMSESERFLRHKVGELAEFPAMFAEQYLPANIQIERRKDRLRRERAPATERE